MASNTHAHVPLFGLLLLITSFRQGTSATHCPGGWLLYQSQCYGLMWEKLKWQEAEDDCKTYHRSGHLASIHDWAEKHAVVSYILAEQPKVGNVWIGLFDSNKNGQWGWSDGSSAAYFSWAKGKSKNKKNGEYCVHLQSRLGYKKWNHAPCKFKSAYLCKARF